MKKRVLIIDDSQTDAAIMKDAFERAGLEVLVATFGEEGIKLALRERPDLVVLDLMLPDITGYEVCRRLRSDPELKNITIVIVSIKHQISEITEAIHIGANDYVIKPSSPDALVNKVKTYLGIV